MGRIDIIQMRLILKKTLEIILKKNLKCVSMFS